MDKPIAKKRWIIRNAAKVSLVGGIGLLITYLVVARSGISRADVDRRQISVAQVQEGNFQEYVPINGTVQPDMTVYLDVEEGGIVEKIYVEGGSTVHKGDLILSFSNTSAQKQNIEAETRLIDNLNQLRNSRLSLTQSRLTLKAELLDVEYRLGELERTHKHYEELMKAPGVAISREQFDATDAELKYERQKRELLIERIARETELQEQQSTQIDASIERVNRNLQILTRIVDSLDVRAPIDGHLSTLSAQVGQRFAGGQRIGQIDRPDGFKVSAEIDQYYISRVAVGQRGRFDFGGRSYEVETTKIYPEVENDTFHADLAFIGAPPEGIKRGQTLNIDLGLSAPRRVTLVSKGSFYQHTGGRWAYVLDEDGRSARRTPISLGRQNPQQVEVLQGLKPGDWIITSSYDRFSDAAELSFPASVKP